MIDDTHPLLKPITGPIKGLRVVRRASGLPERLQVPKLQLCIASGGDGCNPEGLGTKVFASPVYKEWPPGSGNITPTLPGDYEDELLTLRRVAIIGLSTPELEAEIERENVQGKPGDPNDLCVLVAWAGEYRLGDTIRECLSAMKLRALASASVFVVHRESWVNDFGFIATPNCFVVKGRPAAQAVSGHDGVYRKLPEAEAYAASLIAKASEQP